LDLSRVFLLTTRCDRFARAEDPAIIEILDTRSSEEEDTVKQPCCLTNGVREGCVALFIEPSKILILGGGDAKTASTTHILTLSLSDTNSNLLLLSAQEATTIAAGAASTAS
jgi:hypothetical protein